MSIESRLARLERDRPPCPDCLPITYVEEDEDGNLLSGEYPEPCARCGGSHDGINVIVVVRPPGRREEGEG